MLALAFHLGKDRFALRCADVVEVVPRVHLRDIPKAPPYIPGMFTYRGAIVPVIDLCILLWSTPCADRMSSRIILVRQPRGTKVIGLYAERVTEAIELDTARAAPPGIEIADAPYLGEVFFTDDDKMIQLVRIDQLFSGASKAILAGEAQ